VGVLPTFDSGSPSATMGNISDRIVAITMSRPKKFTKEHILDAINRHLVVHGVPPSVEELRRALKAGSVRTVLRYLAWLEEEGDIDRWPGARGMRLRKLPGKGLSTRSVPIVGEAPAGPLMTAEENREGSVRLPESFLRPTDSHFFVLRVRGDSMNRAKIAGERIENGDLVLVRQQPAAEPGAVIVALIDGEATIKRLARGCGYYLLKPESTNRDHEPILVDGDFLVQGVVSRVIKHGTEMIDYDRS